MRWLLLLLVPLTLFGSREGGPYIGIGYSVAKLDTNELYILEEEKARALRFSAGAYINKYLSVEIEYNRKFAFVKEDGSSYDFGYADINTQAHYQFFQNKIDISGKFGAGEVYEKGNGYCLVFGAALSYRYNKRWDIKLGYDYVDIGVDTTNDTLSNEKFHLNVSYLMLEVQF